MSVRAGFGIGGRKGPVTYGVGYSKRLTGSRHLSRRSSRGHSDASPGPSWIQPPRPAIDDNCSAWIRGDIGFWKCLWLNFKSQINDPKPAKRLGRN